MPDTPSARPALTDDITTDDLIARLLAGPELVRSTIAGMTAEQLHARPIEGKMSTHDVVTHIVDSDAGLGRRIRRALAGEEPAALGSHPEIVCDPERDLAAELDRLAQTREQLAEELRSAEPEVWGRVAMHLRDREIDVRGLTMLLVRHLENHVATIQEKKAALGI